MVNLVAADVDDLRVLHELPRRIGTVTELRIPLPGEVRLHARLWLPADAEDAPVPALVEYVPFRHRDFTAPRDALIHPWFAGHGYASLRVELRGSGDSEGLPMDEYVRQEQDDAVAALAWIARQPWCDGNTGMFGMSWGAFSALQVAARNPPSLKAIIPVHGTDDRFSDDIYYKGGCLLTAGLSWGTLYTLYMMRPPDPLISQGHWRTAWLERFRKAPMVLENWMAHQHRDEYWRHGSVAEDHAAVRCPALVICGWADGYTAAALRMAECLNARSRIWIGPWAHTYPHLARPGPRAGFLQEAVRWWDRWLKGRDNGTEALPRVRLYLQDSVPPATSYDHRPGSWLGIDRWPPSEIVPEVWVLGDGVLRRAGKEKPECVDLEIASPLANGIDGPEWLPHGIGPELPPDQAAEDAGSLCFDSAPLGQELVLCGQPELVLYCRADHAGTIQARLVDLRPDGSATQIVYGLLNLHHRNGLDRPEALRPEEWIRIRVRMDPIVQRIPPAHCLRVAVSTQAWPLVWPAARTMRLSVRTVESTLRLPILPADRLADLECDHPCGPAIPASEEPVWLRPVRRERTVRRDKLTGLVERTYIKDDGCYCVSGHGMAVAAAGSLTYRCRVPDPLSAWAEYHYHIQHSRDDWNAAVECDVQVGCDELSFRVEGEYRALENTGVVARRPVALSVPRRWV